MPFRRRVVPAVPPVEWTFPVQELEASGTADEGEEADTTAPPPPSDGPSPRVKRDLDRLLPVALLACAVVATLSMVLIAWMQMGIRDANLRQVCMLEAQYTSFTSFEETDDLEAALEDCGVDVGSDEGDDEAREGE